MGISPPRDGPGRGGDAVTGPGLVVVVVTHDVVVAHDHMVVMRKHRVVKMHRRTVRLGQGGGRGH